LLKWLVAVAIDTLVRGLILAIDTLARGNATRAVRGKIVVGWGTVSPATIIAAIGEVIGIATFTPIDVFLTTHAELIADTTQFGSKIRVPCTIGNLLAIGTILKSASAVLTDMGVDSHQTGTIGKTWKDGKHIATVIILQEDHINKSVIFSLKLTNELIGITGNILDGLPKVASLG